MPVKNPFRFLHRKAKDPEQHQSIDPRIQPVSQLPTPPLSPWSQGPESIFIPLPLNQQSPRDKPELLPFDDCQPCQLCASITLEGLLVGFRHHYYHDLIHTVKSGCRLCHMIQLMYFRAFIGYIEVDEDDLEFILLSTRDSLSPTILRVDIVNERPSDIIRVICSNCENPQSKGCFGLYTDKDDSSADLIPGRRISKRADTDENMQWIASWLDQSLKHDRQVQFPLPRRVIDVGGLHNPPIVFLKESHPYESAPYICLSHCWSESTPLTTTIETYRSRINGFPIASLSPTLRDAISFTRRMGVRYIWIDSLCIVQNSEPDWELESAKMGSYYGSSLLTLCGGRDAPDGLFADRSLIGGPYCRLQLKSNSSPSNLYFHMYPLEPQREPFNDPGWEPTYEPGFRHPAALPKLFTRGWTFQEEILSRRIVSFEDMQIYLRDSDFERYECGRVVRATRTTREVTASGWTHLISSYTKRKLTKDSDKLPALSGLAHHYQRVVGDEYCAGFWRKHLLYCLLWYMGKKGADLQLPRPEDSTAPTWSWASVDGHVIFDYEFTNPAAVVLVDHYTMPSGRDPLGQVSEGYVIFEAPVRRGFLKRREWRKVKGGAIMSGIDVTVSDSHGYLDENIILDAAYQGPLGDVVLLMLKDFHYVVLEPVGEKGGWIRYVRIGVVRNNGWKRPKPKGDILREKIMII